MVLTDDKKETLKQRFQAIFEAEKKIEAYKEEMKNFNDSIKDTFKAIAEDMEIDEKDKEGKKAILDGYKEYKKSIENPSWFETKDEIFLMIKDNDFLGINNLKD